MLFDFGNRIAPERRPPRHYPIVRAHPETGERVLLVNASFTSRIDGLVEAEGARFKVFEHQIAGEPPV